MATMRVVELVVFGVRSNFMIDLRLCINPLSLAADDTSDRHSAVTSDLKAKRARASRSTSAPSAAATTARTPLCGSRSRRTVVISAPTIFASARIVSSISRSMSAGLNSFPTAVVGRDYEILTRFGTAAFSGMVRAACSMSSASVTVAPGFS